MGARPVAMGAHPVAMGARRFLHHWSPAMKASEDLQLRLKITTIVRRFKWYLARKSAQFSQDWE